MMMLVNEQTVFFDWHEPSHPTPPAIRDLFTRRYNTWLAKTFRDRAALAEAWRGADGSTALQADEDPAAGTVAGWDLYTRILRQDAPANGTGPLAPPRVTTLARFLKDLQKEAYADYLAFLAGLGVKVPVTGSNIAFDLADLETCLATGFTSQNMYYEHPHREGNVLSFPNVPEVLCDPVAGGKLVHPGIAAVKVNTLPATATEHDTMWPQEWRSTHNLSVYSMAAFQDWDAIFWYNFMGGYGLSWDDADRMTAIPFATIVVQSLDNAPIASARKLFVTAVARAENVGDKVIHRQTVPTPNGAFRAERVTVTPAARRGRGTETRIEPVVATLSIAGGALRLTPIAADGSALEAARPCALDDGHAVVNLGAHATIWYLLERI